MGEVIPMTAVEGRVPPHDLDSEGAVLSAVMIDPSGMDRCSTVLRAEQFYSEAHRRIYEACEALRAEEKPVDVLQVATWLRDHDRLAQVGGMAYLTEVLNTAPAVANLEAYASTIAEKWQVRQLILVCQRITSQGYAGYGSAAKFIDGAEQAIYEVARQGSARPKLHPFVEVVRERFKSWGDYWKKVESGEIRPGEVSGLSTGLDPVDNATGGLQDGTLVIVAARPGQGKTALVYGIAEHVAKIEVTKDGETNRPYLSALFSLEMPEEEMADRAICSTARVDMRKTRTAMFDRGDWAKLTGAAVQLKSMDQLLIDDTPGLTLTQIRAMTREAKVNAERAGKRLRLVCVDYLQLVEQETAFESREQAVARVSRGLKGLAKEMDLPVIALAQLNRGVETRQDKRPVMADIRESGGIEQDADLIVMIYRDEYYNKDTQQKNIAELIIAKQRSGGPTGTVTVGFDGWLTRFRNLPEGEGEIRNGD